jgi:hypothetical protein
MICLNPLKTRVVYFMYLEFYLRNYTFYLHSALKCVFIGSKNRDYLLIQH